MSHRVLLPPWAGNCRMNKKNCEDIATYVNEHNTGVRAIAYQNTHGHWDVHFSAESVPIGIILAKIAQTEMVGES